MDLTPAERRAALTAIREWLATYSRGRRPDGYADAASAARKLEKECGKYNTEKHGPLRARVEAGPQVPRNMV